MILLLLALVGCSRPGPGVGGDDTADPDRPEDTDEPKVPEVPCPVPMLLEIAPLDVWGRDLDATLSLDRAPDVLDDPAAGPGVLLTTLGDDPVDVAVFATAPDLVPGGVVIGWDGSGEVDGFSLSTPTGGARAVASFQEKRLVAGASCPVFTVYLGLDHPWFAASGRAPSANAVEVLVNGEATWAAVYDDLRIARQRVTWTTWWWESDFELVRPTGHVTMTQAQREPYTVMAVLDDLPHVERRVMINRFWADNLDILEVVNTDAALREKAEVGGDEFEVLLQGNPTEVPVAGQYTVPERPWSFGERVRGNPRYAERPFVIDDAQGDARDLLVDAATWHQKALVIDGAVAYATGMNTKGTDWDGDEHLVFDARRMAFRASRSAREAVQAREDEPDYGPRRDYAARVAGPAARDVEDVLHARWERGLATGDRYASTATPFDLSPPVAPPPGERTVPVQIVATMPEPWGERSILETWVKALAQAEDYVFVEDQYFRAPLLLDVLVARMAEAPDLKAIVVTQPVADYDGGARFTHLADATLRSLYPDRYVLLELRSLDVVAEEGWIWDDVWFYDVPFSLHSKLRIVDDAYVSLGSCNWNNRGLLYEGELDVAILDGPTAADLRARVFADLVGPGFAGQLTGDVGHDLGVLRAAAAHNGGVRAWWLDNADDLDADEAEAAWASTRPSGFVYPLEISPDYLFDVGPDVF